MPELLCHHHVALTVRDCVVSADWYRNTLGFVDLFAEDAHERRARILGFPGGGYSVGLVEHSPADHREHAEYDPTRPGLDHLAFTVRTLGELHDWAEHLTSLDVPHSGVIAIPVGAIVNFTDPDGIALALFCDRE